MDNESHSVRPPEFPKPSASSTLQKHRLQSRLLLGYHSTIGRDRDSGLHSGGNNSGGHNNGGAGPGGGVMYGSDSPSVAGYGYGEALFESRVLEGAGAGAAESSMWSVADSVTTIAVANGRARVVPLQSAIVPDDASLLQSSILSLVGDKKVPRKNNDSGTNYNRNYDQVNTRSSTINNRLSQMYGRSHIDMSVVSQHEGLQGVAQSLELGEVEFCYLDKNSDNFYRYNLSEDIPKSILRNDFVTISKNGLLRNTPGNSELTSLPVVLRENKLYHDLLQFKVFYLYKKWKYFLLLRVYVKRKKFAFAVMQLNNRLHRLDGNFVELYLLVCKLCRLLSTLPTIRVRDNLIYDIQDLVNSQREVLKEKSAMRYGIMEELINHLSKEGEAYLQKALDTVPGTMSLGEYQNARINAKSKNKPLLKSYFDTNKTLKSLNYPFEEEIATTFNGATDAVLETPRNLEKSVLDFKNSNISYTERSALRNNCRKLATFLRLTDFMVRDALYDSVENALFVFEKYFVSLSNLVQGVATNNSSGSRPARADFSYHRPSTKLILPKAFLKIKVTIQRHQEYVATPNYNELGSSIDSLDGSTTAMLKQLSSTVDQYDEEEVDRPLEAESFVIALSPAKEDILEKFEEVINGAINSGRFTDSVCADPRCTRLLKPIEADNLYMELMDRMNREFDNSVNKLRNQCWQRLLQDLQRCHANVSGYNSLCMNYSRHRMVYQKAQRFRLAHDSKDEIADELSRLDKDLEMCNSIPDKHIFGLYQVEYGDFRLLLRQQVKQCKELYHKLIPDLYLVNGDKLNSELANYASTLSLKFTTLEDFVSVVAVFNKAVDCSDDLTSRFTTLESLRELMESSRIYVSEAVHRQAITLRQLWNRFSQLVGDFATAMDENIVVYHNQLKNRVHQLLRPITSADQYLSSNEVANPDTTPETVLIQLSLYKQELEDIQREGAVLEEYQNVLKVSVYNKHTVHDMVELIDANLNLWKIVESTKEMLISYMAVNFLDAASDEVERHIHYSTKILNTSVAQSNSRVSSWLSNSLGELRIIAPVVRKLQSSSLRDEHVDKIHDILGRKIFDEGDVTVGELVDVVKIKSYQTDLDAIYEESVLQYNLEQRLHSAIRHCKALELVYETDRDNRSLSFTTNLESIGTDFQDIRISIESCLQSKYCLPFCEEFITFCAQLTLWIELTESLKFVQEGYIRVRVLFTNARTARYLNQSLKFFKIIDETWRLILNAAKEVAKVVDFYEFPTLKDYLSRCIKAVKEIDLNVRNYLDEQSMKWPKLYLLDSSQLYDIFDTQDPRRTFQKCKILFPFSDDVVFGSEEIFNAVAIMSCGEIMKLKKPCSSRNSVVDWLRAIENNLGEQVKEEIQKFLRGEVILVDNVRNPATSEQSRFAFVQIKFWQEYMQAFHAPSLDKKQKLLQLLGDLNDSMQIYNSYRIGLTSIYAVISLNNLLALLISQRDLLSQSSVKVDDIDTGISSGDSSVTDFAIDICMKLVSVEGELFVKQGPLKIPYGMKYHGFGERLAITPLTERFYFSLNKAFADLTVPIVRSGSGSVGVHTIRNLAFNLGFDAMFIDCHQTFTTSTRIYDHLKALVSTGVWMNFYNYESLSDVIDSTNQTASNLLSVLLSSLSTYRTCMANRSRKFSIGSTTFDVVNPGVLLPRVCLLSKGIKSTDIFIPSAMKQIFRPVKRMQPSRVVMIRVTLEANGLENGFVLAKKLVAFCIYLENNTGIDEETSSAYLIQNIRQIGKSNEFNGLPGYTQLELLIKRLVAMLPLDWRSKIREGDLRYICNLFLDISYSSEIDLKDFLPPYAIIDAEEKLYHYFNPSPQSTASVGNESFSLLVVGDVEVGKSVTIRRIAEKACNDYNAIIDRDIKSGSIKAFQIVTSPKKIYHDKMINPCVSADYEAFVDTAEEFLECLGHTSSLMSAAKNELFSILSVIDKQGPIMIIHLDVQSSLQVSELLVYANTYIEKHSIRAQLVWETTELDHIDPHIAVAFPIVYLQDKIYDLEAIIVERAEVMSIRYGRGFRSVLLSGLKEYIRPCFNNRPKDSLQTSLSIIDGVFKCIDSLYNFFGLDSTASASPQYIDSVYRIIIYACIWVCGVCSNSASSRDDFDKWFKEKYESVNERERNRKLFPSMQATTIFSSYLQHGINNGTSAEWILFEETKAQLNAPPSLTTSEDRERYSLLSLYYSSVNDPLYTKNSASLLVPTATSLAYSVIQSAIMNTGAMLIISGSEGSGKSSLLNALIRHLKAINPTNKANSMAAASRWVCQINDCGPLAMFSHMLRCKLDLSTKRLEYNFSHESNLIYDNGALFVDDVHLSAHVDNHTTCIETIRNLQERKELYNFERKKWQNMARLYVVLAARGEPKKRLNRRLIRHGLLICCQELEVRDCFATKLVHEVPSINQEVVRDLVNLTFNYTTHLKHLCLEAFTEGSGLEGVVKSFYSLVIKNKPISSSVDYLLGKMACALTSMTVFTTNDVLRIWDRTIADFTNRYEPIDEIASQALERIISDYHYDFPSFISVVEREKLMRMSAREAVKVLDSNYSVSNIISYTKNTNGFHKTAANVYPGIDIAEALRDKYLKSIATEKSKHMLTSLGLDLNSLSLWTDVQATLSNLQVRHSSNPLHILVVSGQPQRTVDILLCVCGDYQGEHVWKLNLDPKTIYNANKNIYLGVGAESPTYGALKAEGRDDRFERIAKVLSNDMDRKRTPFLRKSLVLPGNINTNSTSSEDVPSLNLYQLITILLFRKLFSDLSVLGHLKDYLETLTDTDKTRPQSPRRSVTIPTITFAAGVTNIWCRSVVMECHRRLSAVLVDNNFSMPVKDEATICYLPVSKEFARIDNVWDFMSDALSYRSDYADEIITRIHPRLSLRSSYEVRCIVSDYVARQRYVFCFDNPFSNSNFNRNYSDKCEDFKRDEDGLAKVCEGMEQMIHTKSIEDLFSTKRLTPFTIYLPLTSHGYYVAENILNTICGNELAEKVFSLIQNYWRTLVQRFSPNHDDCMQMCGGAQYLLSAVESLHKTYKLLLQSGTKWKSAQKRCWKYVFELYGVDKNTDLAHSEQPTEGGPPIEVQNDTESAPAFSQEIFADAVYITIFSRFFNVVQRTHGAVHDSTALIAELEQLDLHISITDEMRLYDAGSSHRFAEFLPLILLLAMSKVSPTKSLNIGIIISLPITSPLKNLLILIGFLRILRIDFDLIDHTFITSLLLENTLETMADLTHSPTSKFLYSSSISTISVYRQAVLQVDKSAASTTPIFRGKPSSLREAEDSRKKVRNVDCMELENFSQNIKVPIVIPSLSPLTNDAFVLYFIQNGLITPAVPRIVSCFEFLYEASADFIENVLINSDELTKANTDKAPEKANAAVDMTVYESVWKGTCEGLSRSLGVVAVIIQASKSVEELNRSEIMRSLWYQFEKLLRLVLVEHFVNKANSPRGAEVLSESIRSVLSKTTFLLLGKLEELLNSNRYLSLILYVSLKVHFDNTTVEGSRSIGKVIALLSALKGSPVGISMKDIGQKYSEINFAEIIHEEDDELDDDSEADESDSSKHHISSQTLKLVRQYLEFVTKSLNTAKPGHSIFGRYAASTDGGRVAKIGTISTTIVNSIEENISTWLEWIAAPQETPLPVTTGCTLGHLEQLILILLFKPLDLRFHLHKLIAEVGLGCNYSDAAVLEGISQSNSLNNAISGHDIIVHNPEGCNNSLSIIINEKVGDQTSSYALLSTYSIKNYMLYNFNSTLQQFVGNTSTGGDVDSANQSPVGSPYSKAPLFMNDDIISYGISIGLLSPRHKNLILKRKGMLDKSLSMIDSAAMSSRDLLSLNRRISNRSFSRSREDDEEVDIHGRLIGCYNQKPAVYTVLSSGQMDCPSLHSRIADKTAPSMSENIPSYVFLCSGDNRMVTLYDTNTIFVRTNREEYSANSCNNKSLSSARTSKICPTFELPITHKLISYENYHNVLRIFAYCIKDLPIKSLSAGALLVVRLRWLLVFFHTSVSYHLRNAGIYIAADLLVSAAHLIDDIFANLDNFLVETSGNSNGEKKNIITVEKLCEFVVGGVYSTAVTLEMSYRSLSALFTSYLLPGCCDPDSNYTILGNIKLPKDFSEATINSFLEELMSAMNGNASYIELLGSSVTTSSTSVTRAIVDGLGVIKSCNSSCNISNDKMNLLLFRDLKLFLEEKSINSYLANAAVFHLFTQEIEKLVPLIPEKINMESRAIVKRISEHTLGATALLNSAGNKKKVFNPAERRVSNIVNDRRKRGGKIGLVRLQAKEYDSLWAFAMAESHHYNKTVESWRRQLATVASSAKNASTSGMNILHYFESIGIQVRNCTHDLTSIAHMVNSIVNSMTPECWRQSTETHSHNPRISISDNVSVADWFAQLSDRRKVLFDWLTNGYPGAVKLHLLTNPEEFFQALKETYAVKADSSATADKVHFVFTVLNSTTLSPSDIQYLGSLNHSCNVILEDIYLHNAFFQEKNSSVEFFSDYTTSTFGKMLSIQVSPSLDEKEGSDSSVYQCPLFVNSQMPRYQSIWRGYAKVDEPSSQQQPILEIQLNSGEDADDCRMFEIALYSCPLWARPHL